MDHDYTAIELAFGSFFIGLLFAFGPFGQDLSLRWAAGLIFCLAGIVVFVGQALNDA